MDFGEPAFKKNYFSTSLIWTFLITKQLTG